MGSDAPIGVFDSGLGGLTVVRAIAEALPSEDLVYLGDTARVPYGTRSPRTVIRYARGCARMLRERDVKLLVVACNTVSAVALDTLRVELDIPVLGVVGPGARAAVATAGATRIGVIATIGTVASGAYVRAVAAESSRAEVLSHAAPLLVPLVEEGWIEGDVPERAVRKYLEPLVSAGIDVLVLGCTHYPVLRGLIETAAAELAGHPLPIVDSARATADELRMLVTDRGLAAERTGPGDLRLLVTDLPGRFAEMASLCLGRDLEGVTVEQVDL